MVGGQDQRDDGGVGEDPAASSTPTEPLPIGTLLSEVPAEIRDVSFPTVMRGYDRRKVDAYVERVNRIIAELEISRSPQAAVKHALDRVGEQTSGVLQRAREVADELTATALAEAEHATRRAKVEAEEILERAQMQAHQLRGQSKEEADEILARARAEAAETLERSEEQARTLQEGAEARLRALQADIEASTSTRRKVLDELRQTAAELEEFASGAINRSEAPGARERHPEPPTEAIPAKTAVQPVNGKNADDDSAGKRRKIADHAAASSQRPAVDPAQQDRPSAPRRKA